MELQTKYIKKIEAEISETENKIASMERRISRLRAKLKNPEKSMQGEKAAGSRRFRVANGEKVEHKSKNFPHLKKKETEVIGEFIESLPLPIEEEKKSKWSFY